MQCRILLRHIYGASSCFAAPPPPQLALHRNHIPCPNTKLLFHISVRNLCNSMQMMRKKDKLSSSSSSKGNAVINQDILNLTFATQRNTRDQKWKTKRKPKQQTSESRGKSNNNNNTPQEEEGSGINVAQKDNFSLPSYPPTSEYCPWLMLHPSNFNYVSLVRVADELGPTQEAEEDFPFNFRITWNQRTTFLSSF